MRTLTLFAGAGGADLGMQRAGCHHLACIEGDATAVATLVAAGFPGVHGWIGTPPKGSDVPAWAWDGSPVDLLWASPPCQPYSRAGMQLGAADARDGWPATLATIRQVRPRWVIVENVVGSPIEAWAAELGPSLFRAGLYPHVSHRTLDAADWGLPSHRTREFLVAGPEPYRWPEPTHCGPDAPVSARLRLRPWVGFGEALGLVDVVADSGMGKGMEARRGHVDRWTPEQPIGTLRASNQHYVSYLLPGNGGNLFLATGRRRLTWQECAILLGFPPDYPFQGGIGAKYRQIGNAVAPVMAEALVRAILSPPLAAGKAAR